MKKNLFVQLTIVLLLLSFVSAEAQQISGTVTTEMNIPLPGANIVEKGTINGVTSDFDGNYTITISGPEAILVFSYIGYAAKEVAVGASSKIDVSLSEDSQGLDEVIVIGYGTQKRKDVTGATVTADLKSIAELPSTNILEVLNGSLPGIQIGAQAAAGVNPSFQVRGQSTINGNTSPLYVLDGVPYRGNIIDIHPQDIESFTVLKDPSSKAIYGAQAANGIILVTTKKGRTARKPVVTYNTTYSIQSPATELTPLGREGYLQAARDVDWENGYLGPDFTQPNPDWTLANNAEFNAPILEGLDNGTDFDWFGSITNPGYISDHHLSIQGSTGKTNYYFSGGLTKQENWMLNDTFDRTTVKLNIDTKVNDWLSVGAYTFGSFSDLSGESPTLSTLVLMSPLATPFDEDGSLIVNPLGNNVLSPFLASDTEDRNVRNNIYALFYSSIDVPQIEGLNYRINFGNNYRWSQTANASIYGANLTGSAFKENNSTYDFTFDNIVSYKRRFNNDNHGIDATFVVGVNKIKDEGTRAEGSNFSELGPRLQCFGTGSSAANLL